MPKYFFLKESGEIAAPKKKGGWTGAPELAPQNQALRAKKQESPPSYFLGDGDFATFFIF
jgi:hypothetical protein